jgi:predicted RNase H-like nuclease (RuvC/YqgF family)
MANMCLKYYNLEANIKTNFMSNESSGNGSKIIIGVLVVALIGSWIYFNSSKTELVKENDVKVATIDSSKNAINTAFIAASAKVDSLNLQNTQLSGDLLTKTNEINKLKSNISNILKNEKATNKELAEAKTLIAELNGKVSGLVADLEKAQADNKQLTAKNEDLTNQNSTLNTNLSNTTKEKERLQDIGSTLHASAFNIESLRVREDGSERKTNNAKRANTIRVSFQLDKNKITPTGNQDIYVCLTSPEGKSIGDGATTATREDGQKAYSNKLTVQYVQNAVLPVNFDIKQTSKLTEGEYKVEVYNNGFKIGEGKTTLRKGLF